jgi:SAM-dependent MidA family methyltransferase
MSKRVNITTIDNPFDPFDDFRNWFLYDTEKGYYTSSKLARLANYEEDMSLVEEEAETERAIDRLIEIDPLNIYKKITRDQ